MFAIIRIRGTISAQRRAIDTLKMLRLNKKMHCVLFEESADLKGMLQRARDYITWGEITEENIEKLIKKRGRKTGNERLNDKEVSDAIDNLKKKRSEWAIVPVFRLSPPSKGFKKSTRNHYPEGELGYRGKAINDLLERMI